jgi:hypothetical protein
VSLQHCAQLVPGDIALLETVPGAKYREIAKQSIYIAAFPSLPRLIRSKPPNDGEILKAREHRDNNLAPLRRHSGDRLRRTRCAEECSDRGNKYSSRRLEMLSADHRVNSAQQGRSHNVQYNAAMDNFFLSPKTEPTAYAQ